MLTLKASRRGYNIGVRLIEDFLARTGLARCRDFSEVGETMAKVCPFSLPPFLRSTGSYRMQVAFRSFLSITPTLVHHPAQPPSQPQPAFSLIFDENPLTDFVELPEEAVEGGLVYAKILEGVIRGAMGMVSLAELLASVLQRNFAQADFDLTIASHRSRRASRRRLCRTRCEETRRRSCE